MARLELGLPFDTSRKKDTGILSGLDVSLEAWTGITPETGSSSLRNVSRWKGGVDLPSSGFSSTDIQLLGSYNTSGRSLSVQVVGSTAYVADDASGLQVLDVTDPANILLLGSYSTPDDALSVQVIGSTVYVAVDTDGLLVLDATDPANILLLGSYDTPDRARFVQVIGSTAYVADYTSGLQVLDVTDPANILLLGSYNTSDRALFVQVLGSLAYVADDNSGLHVLDVTDPANILLLGSYNTPNDALSVQVVGSTAYVADNTSGLQVLDVTDPANISPLGSYDTPNNALSVQVVGSTAYVADNTSGLQVLDVTDPANILLLGSYNTSDRARFVQVVGSIVYVADYTSGLQVLDLGRSIFSLNSPSPRVKVSRATMVGGFPRDINGLTEYTIILVCKPEAAQLGLFDVQGPILVDSGTWGQVFLTVDVNGIGWRFGDGFGQTPRYDTPMANVDTVVVARKEANEHKIYINGGTAVTTLARVGPLANNSQTFVLNYPVSATEVIATYWGEMSVETINDIVNQRILPRYPINWTDI